MKQTQLLVSGAAGLSGSLIIKAIARRGHAVKALIHRSTLEPQTGVAIIQQFTERQSADFRQT